MSNQPAPSNSEPELRWLDRTAQLMDNRFRVPGTNIRFGYDFLIGLVPYAGDVISFGISGILVVVMARKGASGMVLIKMIGNICLDALVGSIPLLGDLFDLGYKANLRNLHLLREHYSEGRHQGSAWGVILLLLLILFLLVGLFIFVIWRILAYSMDFIISL